MTVKGPADKTRMFRIFFKAQSFPYFEHNIIERVEKEDSELPDNDFIEPVLRDVGLEYIPKRAIRVQKYYMSQIRDLYMGLNNSLQKFVES
jgi:hypothetical protein